MSFLGFTKTAEIPSKTSNSPSTNWRRCTSRHKCLIVIAFAICLLLVSTSKHHYNNYLSISKDKIKVIKNIILDHYGGRHGKILLGTDNLLFEVYGSDNFGSLGVIHCNDIYCNDYSKSYIDNNNPNGFNFANQIYLKQSPITKYPQILYSNAQYWMSAHAYKLKFVTCYDVACSNYTIQELFHSNYNNINDFSVFFIYDTNGNPLISFNNNPNGGLQFIECLNFDCSLISTDSPYTIDHRYNNTGSFNAMFNINDYLIFLYYTEETASLDFAFYNYINHTLSFKKYGIFANDVHGAWLYTETIKDNMVAVVYVDYVSGNYYYGICNIDVKLLEVKCKQTVIDKHISDSAHDYELWEFPDVYYNTKFHEYPVTTYFDIDSFKMAECNNMQCNKNTYIQRLSSGLYGYGRDTNMLWYNQEEIMYISFLDYNGNGNNKKARLVICKKVKQL